MSKQRKYAIGIVSVAIAIVGIAGLVMNCGWSPELFTESTELATRLEAARLLCEESVVVPIGPFAVVVTSFQLVYVVISTGLALFALLVCLIRHFLSIYLL